MGKILIGNIKGAKGDTGVRGTRWCSGTAISDVFADPKVCSGTGIADSLVNDYYLNPDEGNIYRCTLGGDANTAKWVWAGNLNTGLTVDIISDELSLLGSGNAGSNTFNDIAYGNGVFVAVGTNASIYYSKDKGKTWTEGSKTGSTSSTLNAIAYGNGKFIAVGTNGGIARSTDGVNWTIGAAGSRNYRDIKFVSDKFGFVVVSNDNRIHKTSDGSTLSQMASLNTTVDNDGMTTTTEYDIKKVAYGNGKYVAIAYKSVNENNMNFTEDWVCLYSTDGTNWTEGDSPFSGLYPDPGKMIYANDMFVVIYRAGTSSNGYIATSPDGITWTQRLSSSSYGSFNCLAYGNGIFVVIGTPEILTSPDGIKWTRFGNVSGYIYGIAYNDYTFVMVGGSGAYRRAEFAKETNQLSTIITKLTKDIEKLQSNSSDVSKLVSDVEDLSSDLSTAQTDINTLKNKGLNVKVSSYNSSTKTLNLVSV